VHCIHLPTEASSDHCVTCRATVYWATVLTAASRAASRLSSCRLFTLQLEDTAAVVMLVLLHDVTRCGVGATLGDSVRSKCVKANRLVGTHTDTIYI
jgi:hypothetical protein